MSHEIEQMAYTNQVPWHGLGVKVDDRIPVDDMLVKAGLDWTIEKQGIFHSAHGGDDAKPELRIPEYFALVRSSDNKCLDVVGKQYRPVQNKEAFEFFREFLQAGKAKMETAGSLRGGRYVWGLANLNASFKLAGNDEVKGYLLVASPHESGKALIIKFTTIRVVCNNTLTLALKNSGAEFRMAHRVEFNDTMRERAKEVLGIAREQMSEFERNAHKLKKLKLGERDIMEILANVYHPGVSMKKLDESFEKNASPSLKRVMDVLHHAPGADPTTGWGTLNAVTYYADHVASRTTDKRMLNSWFGKTGHHKEMVLKELLKKAS